MKYYEVLHNFDLPKRGNLDYYEIRDFNYALIKKPKEVRELPEYVRLFARDKDLPLNDFPNNHLGWYIVSDRLFSHVEPLITMNIKIFHAPIQITESAKRIRGYSIIQVLKEIDCINWRESDPSVDTGFLHRFKVLTLDSSAIRDQDLFMAKGFRGTAICSQRFVDCVTAHAGTGLYFHEVRTT